ncbi:hypothetical protein ACSMDY_01820 [Raoultella ornithinolytica]|uniref:hypothetical protein n=1 Tax=Raoultella ornithinolytica TaxID=54291 RepID=UPI003F1A721A
MSTHTSRAKNMTLQEASVVSERLMHLVQTIAENYYELEDKQRFSLVEIVCDLTADIDSWMNSEEERNHGTTKRN